LVKTRYLIAVLAVLAMVVAACDGAGDDTTTTPAAETTTTGGAETEGPATAPSSLAADPQDTDGTTIVIASVTLPSPGFIAIHGDAEGEPGPVVGHSDLLPAGDSTDVTVTLDEPLTESGTLWPMVHIDINENGEYEFFPPDETIDTPGMDDAGGVAVIPVEMTVG
jgi:S-layer glycoprotein